MLIFNLFNCLILTDQILLLVKLPKLLGGVRIRSSKDADDADWVCTVLREVDIPIMDHLNCNAAYGAVPDNTICTNGSGGKGVCGVSQERKRRNCRLTTKNPEYQLIWAILAECRQLDTHKRNF